MVRGSSVPKGSASATVGEGEADGDIEGANRGRVQAQRESQERKWQDKAMPSEAFHVS